jgi:hypothetical protein
MTEDEEDAALIAQERKLWADAAYRQDQIRALAQPRDAVVEAVCADLLQRSQVGIAKYGTTLDGAGLSRRDWLQHAYEETLDTANYLKAAIMELDKENDQ